MRSFYYLPTLAAIVAALCAPPSLAGQILSPGVRVRATVPVFGPPVEGTLVALDADTLVILSRSGRDTIRIHAPEVTRIEVSRGRHHNTLGDAGAGAILGGLTGALLGAVAVGTDGSDWVPASGALAGGALVGAGAGLVIGAVIGSIHTSERWDRAKLPAASSSSGKETRVQVAPVGRRGLAVVVSRTF